MVSNREKIEYVQDTVKDKGYNINVFQIDKVNGHPDVVWNIALYPHRVCEYFRQQDVKIVPIKGTHGLTSLWFDSDPFPNRFYELVDDLPELKGSRRVMEYNLEGAFDSLLKSYPTMVNAVMEQYPEYTTVEVIDFLMHYLNFSAFVTALSDDKFLIEELVLEEK